MAADLRSTAQAFFTAVLLIGSLSAGLPIPQNAAMEMPATVEAIPVQQPNEDVMTQALQQPQKVDVAPTAETAPGTPMMVAPLVETPSGEMPLLGTPLGDAPSVVQQPLQAPQQPAAPALSRPDCPEITENHTVVCQDDDKKDDSFQLIKDLPPASSPVAEPTQ